MQHRFTVRNHALAALAFASIACSESSGTEGITGSPSNAESKPVLMGNFAINTGNVTTNQDGASKNAIDDYVLPSQLPGVNFEVFTIHLYAPVANDVSTTVSNVRVTVGRTDGSRTGNIFQSGEFVQRTSVNGQEYAVYRLNGFYNLQPTLTRANFANVAFELALTYQDSNGNKLAERAVTLSVYQRQ
ncbi:MAG TPA: hypothetical protein VF042_00670 [Gemmatimonadaceae bacterium]